MLKTVKRDDSKDNDFKLFFLVEDDSEVNKRVRNFYSH